MEKKENLVLKKTENLTKFFLPSGRSFDMIIHGRGISAAGSAPRWQRGGRGFEPHMLHWKVPYLRYFFLIVLHFVLLRYNSYKKGKLY